MPPAKPNPAAGKRPANARWKSYTRSDGTKVRGHSRSVHATRIKNTAIGTGSAGTVCTLVLFEAGFTILAAVAMTLTAAFTWLLWRMTESTEKNRTRTQATRKKGAGRRTTRSRTGTRTRTSQTRRPR